MPSDETLRIIERVYNALGTLASFVSLALSIAVLSGVNRIRKEHLFAARSSEHIAQLRTLADQLVLHISSFDRSLADVKRIISRLEGVLRALNRTLSGPERKSVSDAISLARQFRDKHGTIDEAQRIQLLVFMIIEETESARKDLVVR
jgi:hypothetical protein